MKQGFNSIIGDWGVFVYRVLYMQLSHNCTGTILGVDLNPSGACVDCDEQIPECVAQAALLLPNFSSERYPELYREE